jgi:hypothetical protein
MTGCIFKYERNFFEEALNDCLNLSQYLAKGFYIQGQSKDIKDIHRNGNSVYIFLLSVSDLYIPRIGPHISSSRKGRPNVEIYNSLTDT